MPVSAPERSDERRAGEMDDKAVRRRRDRQQDVRSPGRGGILSDPAAEARSRWGRAAWFAAITYFAWSPYRTINQVLPAGSATRGVVLTVIPVIGVLVVMRTRRTYRVPIDLLVVLLALLVVWESIAVERNAGTTAYIHVVPSLALLGLAIVARSSVDRLSVREMRWAIGGVVAPLCCLLILGGVAQYLRLVPSSFPSAIGFSIHGYRLQGLADHPDGWGFLAAVVTLIAFVAYPGKWSWTARVVGLITVFASDSRTAIIALGFGLFVLWVFGPGRNVTRRVTAALLIVAAGSAVWGIIDVKRQSNTDVLSNRDLIWKDLVPYLHHLPVFGYGPNFFVQIAPQVLGPYTSFGQVLDPQNQWLNDSLEFGFVAALALTACLLVIPLWGSRSYRSLVLFPLLAMVLLDALSEVPLAVFYSISGAFPLFLLVMWAPERERSVANRLRIDGRKRRMIAREVNPLALDAKRRVPKKQMSE